jgi:hypothetical protein
MGELAVLLEWTLAGVEVVLAHLGLVLLLQRVELALVAVEVVVVRLLGEVSQDFAGWVVEVLLWLSVVTKLTSVFALIWFHSTNNNCWRGRVEVLLVVSLDVAFWRHWTSL